MEISLHRVIAKEFCSVVRQAKVGIKLRLGFEKDKCWDAYGFSAVYKTEEHKDLSMESENRHMLKL